MAAAAVAFAFAVLLLCFCSIDNHRRCVLSPST